MWGSSLVRARLLTAGELGKRLMREELVLLGKQRENTVFENEY